VVILVVIISEPREASQCNLQHNNTKKPKRNHARTDMWCEHWPAFPSHSPHPERATKLSYVTEQYVSK